MPLKDMKNFPDETLSIIINQLAADLNSTAHEKGWWDEPRSDPEVLFLVHSEVSEIGESLREPIAPVSNKIPGFSLTEEEAADVAIRLFEWCHERGLDIGGAIAAKAEYNKTRPHKHGKKF